MPELPEIETVKRIIGPQVLGKRISSISCDKKKIIGHPSADGYEKGILSHEIIGYDRRGKALILYLDRGTLIFRFGMTGQMLFVPTDFPKEDHTHLTLGFDDGTELRYIDQRMFGKTFFISEGEEDVYSGIQRMGPEPFDKSMSGTYLKNKLGNREASIKEVLLDQSIVAGIGNIWGDEILFRCGICPEAPCNMISDRKWKTIAATIPEVMEFGIEKNEITPEEYLEGRGRKYYDIDYLQVYGRKDMSCFVCGTKIRRSELGGRSSYWCPKCQKMPRKRSSSGAHERDLSIRI